MNRGDAYAVLARELERWNARPLDELRALVNGPASEDVVRIGEEDVTVRVWVRWADAKKESFRVDAAADGPSTWKLDRLVESVVVEA